MLKRKINTLEKRKVERKEQKKIQAKLAAKFKKDLAREKAYRDIHPQQLDQAGINALAIGICKTSNNRDKVIALVSGREITLPSSRYMAPLREYNFYLSENSQRNDVLEAIRLGANVANIGVNNEGGITPFWHESSDEPESDKAYESLGNWLPLTEDERPEPVKGTGRKVKFGASHETNRLGRIFKFKGRDFDAVAQQALLASRAVVRVNLPYDFTTYNNVRIEAGNDYDILITTQHDIDDLRRLITNGDGFTVIQADSARHPCPYKIQQSPHDGKFPAVKNAVVQGSNIPIAYGRMLENIGAIAAHGAVSAMYLGDTPISELRGIADPDDNRYEDGSIEFRDDD